MKRIFAFLFAAAAFCACSDDNGGDGGKDIQLAPGTPKDYTIFADETSGLSLIHILQSRGLFGPGTRPGRAQQGRRRTRARPGTPGPAARQQGARRLVLCAGCAARRICGGGRIGSGSAARGIGRRRTAGRRAGRSEEAPAPPRRPQPSARRQRTGRRRLCGFGPDAIGGIEGRDRNPGGRLPPDADSDRLPEKKALLARRA